MARIRAIHPDLPSDRKLASVPRDARLTYVLTWCIADDAGLFRAEPRQLLGQLYPHDADVEGSQLEAWLSALVDLGVLRWRSNLDGARVGQLVNWPKRQKIDRPSKSFLASELRPLAEGSRVPGEVAASLVRGDGEPLAVGVLSPEPRVLSPESGGADPLDGVPSFALLRSKLDPRYHGALTAYVRGAHQPAALCATILAEGPDTGTNGAAGRTWAVIGQALLEMQAAGKPFTPNLLRAFCRKLQEVGPGGEMLSPSEQAFRAADQMRAAEGAQ